MPYHTRSHGGGGGGGGEGEGEGRFEGFCLTPL